jgi:TrmH family RNA methyltransferase
MMITSKQNTLIKEVRSLLSRKFRDKLNRYVVEGVKMVNEAFATDQKVLTVISTEKCLARINAKDIEVQVVSDQVYASISDE